MEPVTLTMAKAQVRAEGTTVDDVYLTELIQSAREYVEAYCGIRIVAANVEMTFSSFDDLVRLTHAPVTSVVDVRYLDLTGTEQVLAPSVYQFLNVDGDVLRPRIRLAFQQTWPSFWAAEDAIRVNAAVGYSSVPLPLIRAMLLLIGQWYDNRQPIAVDVRGTPTALPNTVEALLSNYRR